MESCEKQWLTQNNCALIKRESNGGGNHSLA